MPALIESNAKEGDNRGHSAAPQPPQSIRNSDSSNEKEKVRKIKIYIDHTNFWITGGRVTGDPYWPYDAISLLRVLVEHTRFWDADQQPCDVTADVYGSAIWRFGSTWTKLGTTINEFVRSGLNQEKEVDTSLVADSVAEAVSNHFQNIETEFVIISGDRDMRPAINKIMEGKFQVHLWSWDCAVSAAYERLHKEHQALVSEERFFKLHPLDDFRDHFA
ncbi:NYN domain-containing protein [Fusarium sp. LHS14.1]|nr:NYN domain-containing protein [Fusarium sp. LHS14.1]